VKSHANDDLFLACDSFLYRVRRVGGAAALLVALVLGGGPTVEARQASAVGHWEGVLLAVFALDHSFGSFGEKRVRPANARAHSVKKRTMILHSQQKVSALQCTDSLLYAFNGLVDVVHDCCAGRREHVVEGVVLLAVDGRPVVGAPAF
jgi:hypothetical protein